MSSGRAFPSTGPSGPGPQRRVLAWEYLLTSGVGVSVALWPGWHGVHRLPLLLLAAAGLIAGLAVLASERVPLPGPRLSVLVAAVGTSAAVYFADGSAATGALVVLYCASASHAPFLPSRRAVVAAVALPFLLLPAALVAAGHAGQVLGWLAVLPCTSVVPVLTVRSLLRAAERRGRRDAGLDLLNRAGLLDRCAHRVQQAAQAGPGLTVSVAHFDDLRDVRLALGPAAAEEVLAECARRAAALPGAVVARTDTDSLAVVLPGDGGTGDGGAEASGLRVGGVLRDLLREHVVLRRPGAGQGLRVRPEVSLGIACAPTHGRELEDLLALADVAAGSAAARRGGVAVAVGAAAFDVDALQLHTELPAALADGQLRVHYQPLVAAGTGRMVGVEALVRWQHPERGLLGPGAFVPLAERSDAIGDLTRWVLREAVAQCAAWRAAGHEIGVSVNLSAKVLADPTLVDTVRATIAEHRLEPSVLTLEVTESALLQDPAGAGAVLAALRAAGARISLDDFGTGYTSLTMLRQLEADELKIDRTFVAAAPQAATDAAIVRALADLAHRLSMEVVAEGVEDARTAELVTALGADVLQGFHFARPVPADQLFQALRPAPAPTPSAGADPSQPCVEVPAPRPCDEPQRLVLARRTRERARAARTQLEKVVALAAEVCGTDFASLNVLEEDVVHLVSRYGHEVERLPRDGTPCAWTGVGRDVVELHGLDLDPRFAGGVAVAAGVRRYAGAPVLDGAGRTLGVLCVYDQGSQPFGAQQLAALRSLAAQAADHLDGAEAASLLSRAHSLLQALPEVDRAGSGCELVPVLAGSAFELLRPDALLVVSRTPVEGRWEVVHHLGDLGDDLAAGIVFDLHDRSGVARAVTTRRPVWVPDAMTSSLLDPRVNARLGASSVLVVPVVGADGVDHVLSASWREEQPDLHPVLRDAVTALAARVSRQLTAALA